MTQSEFLNIVMPFKDKVFRLAKRLLISTEEAEDATQEVLMKLWSNKTKIEDYKNVVYLLKKPSCSEVEKQQLYHSLKSVTHFSLDKRLHVKH